jgi:hypothetical protein
MKRILLLVFAGLLAGSSAFASTLQPDSIFAVSQADLKLVAHFCAVKDYGSLEQMDRENRINVFKAAQTVNVMERGWDWVSFTFPGKTKVLYTATEFVTD